MAATDSIQIFVPLTIRKKNGRPKIMPPANDLPREDQKQSPISCARSAGHGASGGAWRPVSSARFVISLLRWGWRSGT